MKILVANYKHILLNLRSLILNPYYNICYTRYLIVHSNQNRDLKYKNLLVTSIFTSIFLQSLFFNHILILLIIQDALYMQLCTPTTIFIINDLKFYVHITTTYVAIHYTATQHRHINKSSYSYLQILELYNICWIMYKN